MRPGQPNLSPERHERILKAVALKLRGKSYRAIASDLGVSVSVAFDDVWHHFSEVDKLATEKLEQIRKLELARLDVMLEKLFDIVDREAVERLNSKGEPSGETVDVDGTAIKAITAAAKLMERRAKLLGLDAPTKVQGVPSEKTPTKDLVAAVLSDEEVRAEVLEQLKGAIH